MGNIIGHLYHFAPFSLDAKKRLLLRGRQPVPLTSKAFDTLLLLVQNTPRVMEKDELMKALWPDSFVEEANLAQNISMLRKVLGESPTDHRYIVTVPGRGYQFVAELRERGEEPDAEVILERRTVSRVVVEEEESEGSTSALPEGGPLSPRQRPTDLEEIDRDNLLQTTGAERDSPLLPQLSGGERPGPRRRVRGSRLAALAMLGAAAALIVYGLGVRPFLHHNLPHPAGPRLQQLTTSPMEVPVLGAAISPDGRLLAYIDRTGIFVRVIQTGETQPVRFIAGFTPFHYSLKWFPDGAKLLLSSGAGADVSADLWVISVLGEAPVKLREGAWAAVSPDGSQIAYINRGSHAISLMGANGEAPREAVTFRKDESVSSITWAPSAHRIAYAMQRTGEPGGRIETCDLAGGRQTEVLSSINWGAGFDLVWTPAGRLIYPYSESGQPDVDSDLWEVRLDPETGERMGSPERATPWLRSSITNLTATTDGKRVAFLRFRYQTDVYVGELSDNGARMAPPRRLTLDDANDWPQGWTRDSRAVLFHSDRRGRFDIFGQGVLGGAAQAVVSGPDEKTFPRTTSDGRWVLYWASSSADAKPNSGRLMRVPAVGGPPELILNANPGAWFRCPTRTGASCVLGERTREKVTFFALDPIQGKGAELRSLALSSSRDFFWDLSPDGSQVVVLGALSASDRFQVVPLAGGRAREVVVRGWKNLFNVVWSSDGKGFFAFTGERPVASLLRVEFDGSARLLWKSDGLVMYPQEPVPSPDGRFLAYAAWTGVANAWMIENF